MKVSELIEKLNKISPDCECYTVTAEGVEKVVNAWVEPDFTDDHKDVAYIEIVWAGGTNENQIICTA